MGNPLGLLLVAAGARLAFLLLQRLGPHLPDVFHDQVAMAGQKVHFYFGNTKKKPVESLDFAQELLVIAAADQHLGLVAHRIGQHRERADVELLVLLLLSGSQLLFL